MILQYPSLGLGLSAHKQVDRARKQEETRGAVSVAEVTGVSALLDRISSEHHYVLQYCVVAYQYCSQS